MVRGTKELNPKYNPGLAHNTVMSVAVVSTRPATLMSLFYN